MRDTAPIGPMFAAQARVEFLRLLRSPAFAIATIALPIMFYAFFALQSAHETFAGIRAGVYFLGSYSAYAAVTISLFSFGISVAAERDNGATRLMRALPLRPSVYLGAKLAAAIAFCAIAIACLTAFTLATGAVRMPPAQWLGMLGVLLAGSVPFTVLGFAIGYLVNINSAVAVLNLINLPMSFGSGLFMPLAFLPPFVKSFAPYLPSYHLAQLAWTSVGAPGESAARAFGWLAAYFVLFAAVALRAYRREERKSFA